MVKLDRYITRRLRGGLIVLASAAAVLMATPAAADFQAGVQAYKSGQVDLAIELWKRYAIAGDVQSRKVLGDIYSGHDLESDKDLAVPLETVQLDNVKALTWYTLAAYYEFSKYEHPTAADVNARIVAQQRLPIIRTRMKSSDVRQAEKLIAQTYESGTPYDLYRLGKIYQSGAGLEKDNVKALSFYALAKDRGVAEASTAFDDLKDLTSKSEQKRAQDFVGTWQPPLPPEHQGKTPQQEQLEKLKKELEEIKLADALGQVSDIDIELIQRALNALGYRAGAVDDSMGPATEAAIRRYQSAITATDSSLTDEEKARAVTGKLTPRQTVRLIGDAAAKGHPFSQYVYGVMYISGIGVEKDGAAAVKWLNRAADQNLAIAHYALGVVYRDSTTGLNEVQPDKKLAAYHFAQAVALGYTPAQAELEKLSFDTARDSN